MSAVSAGVRFAVRALPPALRRRYQEEWEADLAGARELGISPGMVLVGAVGTVLAVDRTDPMITGVPRWVLRQRRGRWAVALLLAAALVSAGSYLFGYQAGSLLGVSLSVIMTTFGLAGCWMLISAFRIPPAGRRPSPPGTSAVIIRKPAPGSERWGYGVGFGLATLAVATLGLLDIAVWGPLAKVPGSSLGEIYAAMAAAGEGTGVVWLIGWVIIAACGVVGYLVLCGRAGRSASLTRRRLLALGLLLVGGTVVVGGFAGFAMGMGLADTFSLDGGVEAPTGPALRLIGLLALSCGIVLGLTDRSARR
ncbi:hypothetical protein [Microlunatus sp. GCM10028923]|uniref:hypothetical protein n=1 Tax=Microlunatus sp. GCM10028923 TaxID=3273400 RepID=UPI00361BE029